MKLSPENARSCLLDLFLARENCKTQLLKIEEELRDVRNYVAGVDAAATQPVEKSEN